ncbi:MAG: Fic family protein [Erysipelotrichaceae bacterium]
MSDSEEFINNQDRFDPLIKIALIHYQFETIHPFLDGNGRIGRLMINLYLKENQLLSLPTLYISCFLKHNRIEYYDRLTEVREKGNFEQWVKFFLKGIYESSVDSVQTIDALSALHDRNLAKVTIADTRTKILTKLFTHLEQPPIIDINKTASELGTSYNTISSAVKRLIDIGILKKVDNSNCQRCFAYEEYLVILRKVLINKNINTYINYYV